MNIEVFLFYIFSSLAIICGIMVISSRNPVFSVLFLVLVFCNAAGLLLLLETDFLAMLFLIVYVGAIAVLFLFVVMMLNVRITTLKESVLRYLPIGGLILFIFFFEVISVINGDLIPFFIENNLVALGWAKTNDFTGKNREHIKQELLKQGKIYLFYELSGKVVSRTLTECVVKIVDDQWFLNYNNPEWKKLAHDCVNNMKFYPEKSERI